MNGFQLGAVRDNSIAEQMSQRCRHGILARSFLELSAFMLDVQ